MKATEFRKEVAERLTGIEHDLKYHIQRTDLLESRIAKFEKLNNFLTVLGRLLVVGAAGVAIARFLLG